jgi:thioredoxin 1
MANHPKVVAVDDDSFDTLVLRSDKPVLVEFGGKWCGPCKALAPVIAKLVEESGGRYTVAEVDIDDSPEVAKRYGIRGLPTVIAFAGGAEKGKVVGVASKDALLALLR